MFLVCMTASCYLMMLFLQDLANLSKKVDWDLKRIIEKPLYTNWSDGRRERLLSLSVRIAFKCLSAKSTYSSILLT